MTPSAVRLRRSGTHRLIPTRYPPSGILDRIADPADLEMIFELEGWTNDRISSELGLLHSIPREEWVVGRTMASVVMAAYCHPHPAGGRFNGSDRGAWYAAVSIETAHAEAAYHRGRELAEVGVFEARLEMREYRAGFDAVFHDARGGRRAYAKLRDPDDYSASQALARELLGAGSNGIVYPSVRNPGGECLACFRPRLVRNVRVGTHFEYRFEGGPTPTIRALRQRS
jgi:RES domain-containing protein